MPPPEKVGQVEIQALLGESQEGTEYKGLQPNLNRTVAIRLLAPDLASDDAYRTRFLAEAKKSFNVNVAGACRMIDVGHCKTSDQWFISYEFTSGHSTPETLEWHGGKLDPRNALELGVQICEALVAAEQHGLHHGDIRPERVRVDSEGVAKLLDLGLAKRGAFERTDPYAAPERIAGKAPSAPSDLYSLGAWLYLIITGETPARGKAPAYDVRRVIKTIARPVGKLVWTLTTRTPKKRFPNAKAALEAMTTALESLGAPSEAEVAAAAAAPKKAAAAPKQKPEPGGRNMSSVRSVSRPSGRFKTGSGFDAAARKIESATPKETAPAAQSPEQPASSAADAAADAKLQAADEKLKAAEAMLKAAEEKLKAAESGPAEPSRTASGRIQRGTGYYDSFKPTASAQRPEIEPSPEERTASGRIQRATGYYDVMKTEDEAKPTTEGAPKLSLDDPLSFQAGWDIFVREKGKPGKARKSKKASVRADHYFHKIVSTMEKVPAFMLTVGPALSQAGDVEAPSQLLLGEGMERAYKVERQLGKGGQGTVYKATIEGNKIFDGYTRPVKTAAVKMSKNQEAILSERAIYSQPNPGVIKLLDFGRVPGKDPTDYMVLERLYPHPFQLFTRDGQRSPVDLATAVDSFVNLLMTLHELHFRKDLPLVLCDIKPDNIMLRMSTEDGGTPSLSEYLRRLSTGAYEPVLLDMGCAQHHGELRKARGRLGCILGTPLYMSPEAAPSLDGDTYVPGIYTAKLDVYSLTLTFYHYITGVRPYTHRGLFKRKAGLFDELMRYKKEGIDPVDYALLEQKVGAHRMDDFVEILQKGLHPDPDYRASAKILFKLCEKKFKVVETRLRDTSEYFYDDIKGLSLAQEHLPRIRASFNMYLNPESAEFSEPPRARTRRFSRGEVDTSDQDTRQWTGQFRRPDIHDEPTRKIRGTGMFKRPKKPDA